MQKKCSVAGCDSKHYGCGYCSKHHKRWKKHGDPGIDLRAKRRPIEERFWEKVVKTDGCWLWTGAIGSTGYGHILEGGKGSRILTASRVAYELANGPIAGGAFVLHKCDIPTCVNPDHLFLGDNKANAHDMINKGRCKLTRGGGSGEHAAYRKLAWDQVLLIKGMLAAGSRQADIAEQFEVSQSAISKISRGASWLTQGAPREKIA